MSDFSTTDHLEQNKAIVRHLVEEMDSGRNIEVIKELLTSDCVIHFSGQSLNLEDTLQANRMFYNAFPDLRHTVEDLIAEGDKVVVRATDQGTHRGDFQGVAPTGKRVRFGIIAIYRILNGKIVEAWEEGDFMGLIQQLGAELPAQ